MYSLQKDVTKPLNMSVVEFEQWLELCMYFSISKIFNTRLHWNVNFLNDTVNKVMNRDRWLTIKANLHYSNNENIDHRDKNYKIQPLYEGQSKNNEPKSLLAIFVAIKSKVIHQKKAQG